MDLAPAHPGGGAASPRTQSAAAAAAAVAAASPFAGVGTPPAHFAVPDLEGVVGWHVQEETPLSQVRRGSSSASPTPDDGFPRIPTSTGSGRNPEWAGLATPQGAAALQGDLQEGAVQMEGASSQVGKLLMQICFVHA